MNAIPCHAAPHRPPPHSSAFVQLHSGACVDLMAPDFTGVSLTDFATGLSRLARFNGATRGPRAYSVAQHCVLVMEILQERAFSLHLQRAGLLHDAHEAVMGDIATPVKSALGGAVVQELEARLQSALALRFGLRASLFGNWALHQADQVALMTERRDLMAPSAWPWPENWEEPIPTVIQEPWVESVAHIRWLQAASQLGLR